MGWRFRRRVRLLPGLRLNISKRGGSLSLGRPGLTANLGRGGAHATLGLPGSGISYRTGRLGRARRGGGSLLGLLLVLAVIIAALVHFLS